MRATKKSGDGGGASGAAASGISAAVHYRNSGGVARRVTALCDAELLGRVLKSGGDGDCTLDLEKYREFYSGEVVSEDEATLIASQADNLNVVGEKSLAAARRAFAINPRNVKRVGGVPHAQVYRM